MFDKDTRKLKFKSKNKNIEYIKVRSFDACTFVAFGAAHIGIAGEDVIKEFNFSEMELTVNIDARSDADSQPFEDQGGYQEDTTAVSQKQRLDAAQESGSVVRPQTRLDGSLNLYA